MEVHRATQAGFAIFNGVSWDLTETGPSSIPISQRAFITIRFQDDSYLTTGETVLGLLDFRVGANFAGGGPDTLWLERGYPTATAWTTAIFNNPLDLVEVSSLALSVGPNSISMNATATQTLMDTAGWSRHLLLRVDIAFLRIYSNPLLTSEWKSRYEDRLDAAYCGRCGFITPRSELVRDGWTMALVCKRCWNPPEPPEPSTTPDDEWKEPL